MQLPIGYDDFGEILDHKLDFVDKTLFIKDILDDESAKAIVITRPRRFGKTFNLSLLHYFLSPMVYGKATQGLFDPFNIARCSDEYMQHQGKYPVISITFKDIKELNYTQAQTHFSKLFSDLYLNYKELLSSPKLDEEEKQNFQKIVQKKANEIELRSALRDLMHYLFLHHGTKPWLLIDEYDTPIHAAYSNNYYDEMINFMRGLFGAALKNNPYLYKAVITGILRIAKESLFSGINNLKVYSVLHSRYSEYFGFTEIEVNHILIKSHLLAKADEIKAWYNGYQFGDTTIYNPWSIAYCIQEQGKTAPYWINTSDNELIRELLKKSPLEFKTQFEKLIQGDSIEKLIDENMVFGDLEKNSAAAWSLLLMSGYLTPVHCESLRQGTQCQLRVPNQEVNNLYRNIIELWLSNGYGLEWYNQFAAALVSGNMGIFRTHLEKVLLQIVSCHDLAKEPEAFFHGLLLGFIASLQETHEIKSNRESGLGRYDILLIPKDSTQLGIVIELKAKSSSDNTALEALAETALKQIDEKHYATELKQRGIQRILKIAIAFSGKIFALSHAVDQV